MASFDFTCVCGDAADEHDRYGECQVEGCSCIFYESDSEAEQE